MGNKQLKTFDVVRLQEDYHIENSDKVLRAGEEGVIVESYLNEFLVEFTKLDTDYNYVLIKGNKLKKIWDSENETYCD